MAPKPKPISTHAAKPAATKAAASKVVKDQRAATAKTTSAVTKATGASKPSAAASAVGASGSPQTTLKVVDPAAPKAEFTNANSLKKKDLIERVLKATGGKKKGVREIVEATLTVLGDALSKGEMLNLPPFGKAKVSRPSDAGSGKAMTVKLRRGPGNGAGGGKAKQALADAEE